VIKATKIDNETKLDPDKPMMVGEVTPDGQHMAVDFGSLFAVMGSPLKSAEMEMWATKDRLVVDSTGYQAVLDLNPSADLGPFTPGIGFVDFASLGVDNPKIIRAIAGSGPADLAVMAKRLPTAITQLRQTSDKPVRFAGKATYADFLIAQGGDLDVMVRSAAVGMATNMKVPLEDMVALYRDFYTQQLIDIVVELDDKGRVHIISSDADMSGIFSLMFDGKYSIVPKLDASDLQEAKEVFANAEFTMQTRVTFEPDDSIVLKATPANPEDRTDRWRAYLVAAGLIDK
jgi:hypothetical protein